MNWLAWLSLGLSVPALLFGVWANGYNYGVRDTERRWINAVSRAGHK